MYLWNVMISALDFDKLSFKLETGSIAYLDEFENGNRKKEQYYEYSD